MDTSICILLNVFHKFKECTIFNDLSSLSDIILENDLMKYFLASSTLLDCDKFKITNFHICNANNKRLRLLKSQINNIVSYTFSIEQTKCGNNYYRFLHLRQTEPNKNNRYYLSISTLEFCW